MTFAVPTGAPSFNITANTNQLDLSAELAELIRTDNSVFISRLGESIKATQTRHYWNEDKLITNLATDADAGGLATGTTTVNVTAGQGTRFKIGTIFKDRAKGQTEILRVSAISTDALTVERGAGGTTAQTHAGNFAILIIAHTRQEDQDMNEDDTQERTSVNNLTQVFQRGVRISYTREKINNNAIASEFAHQVAYRMKEEMRNLDASVINSGKSIDAGSSTDYRSMGGLIPFVSQAGGNIVNTTENLAESVINDLAELIINQAGTITNGFILCSPKLRRVISTFDQAFRRGEFSQTFAGFYVEKFITDMGFELEVIQDPWVPNDTIIIGDLDRVKLVALQNDEMRFEELAKLGRSYRGQITGQYSVEVRNATGAFAYHNNLS